MDEIKLQKLRIGFPKIPGFMLISFAKMRGYFEHEGIDLEIEYIERTIGKDIPRFAKGEFDIFSASNTIYAGNSDLFKHGKWAYTLYFSSGGMAYVARKGLYSLFDARGKTFSNIVGSKFTLAWVLKKAGLSLSDVKTREDPIPDIAGMVERGEVDFGYVASPMWEVLRDKGFPVVFTSSEEPGLVTLGLVMSDKLIADKRSLALKFLRAYLSALVDMRKDDSLFLEYVSIELATPKAALKKLFEKNIRLLGIEENLRAINDGATSLENIKLNLRYISLFLAGQGQAETVAPDHAVASSLVSEIAEKQTLNHKK